MYTDDEIRSKLVLAEAARLSGRELLEDFAAVRRDCNGIGAEWMPARLRKVISKCHPSLCVVADIHDRHYALGGSELDRRAADDEFVANGERMAKFRYAWYDPRRYWVIRQARQFGALLERFGKAAYHYDRL